MKAFSSRVLVAESKGDAQGLCTSGENGFTFVRSLHCRDGLFFRTIFNGHLAVKCVAPWSKADIFVVNRAHEAGPILNVFDMLISGFHCFLIHFTVNCLEQFRDLACQGVLSHLELFPGVSDGCSHLALLKVFLSEFEAYRCALYLPVVEFKTWVVIVAVVDLYAQSSIRKLFCKLVGPVFENLLVVILVENRNDDHLRLCNLRWNNNSRVVRVNHYH